MRTRSLVMTLVLGLGLTLAACEPEAAGPDSPDAAAAAPDADPAAPDADPAAPDGASMGLAGFLEPCPTGNDAECEAGLTCFPFNMDGPHCTHSCTIAADCEVPSTGCNGMGVCKVN